MRRQMGAGQDARRRFGGRAIGVLCLATVLATPAWSAPGPLTVFAAASLKNSLDAVDAAYTQATGRKVVAAYAASSTLARQIEQGAPADVFISADSDWMDDVQRHGEVAPAARTDLLTNNLALIAPKASSIRLAIAPGFPLARALGDGRLAMAAPQVPAGRYGRDALTALRVWPQVQAKVVYGDSVRAALAFVDRGEAPLGIVYDTDAGIDPGVRVVGIFPPDSHPRIVYPIAPLVRARGPDVADYLRFVEGPRAAVIFARFGFTRLRTPQ